MSDITVVSKTQEIHAPLGRPTITVDVPNATVVSVTNTTSSISVVNAGPQGPPGMSGDMDTVELLEEVDSKIAAHSQSVSPVHDAATSGRDFSALFQNGLI